MSAITRTHPAEIQFHRPHPRRDVRLIIDSPAALPGKQGKTKKEDKDMTIEQTTYPAGYTAESAYQLQDGPREQVVAGLERLVRDCRGGSAEAEQLADEAEQALAEINA